MSTIAITTIDEAECLHNAGSITDAALEQLRKQLAPPQRTILLHKRTPCERRRYLRRHMPSEVITW